jgi:hypothetical protein
VPAKCTGPLSICLWRGSLRYRAPRYHDVACAIRNYYACLRVWISKMEAARQGWGTICGGSRRNDLRRHSLLDVMPEEPKSQVGEERLLKKAEAG